MIIYNVLFKGVEINHSNQNYAKAFATLEEANEYVEEGAKTKGLKIMSELGFTSNYKTIDNLTDYRCEDKSGNSYYYVIYVQKLKL